MVNRITGLSGAMDVDGTVQKLMDAERVPLDKMNQKKQVMDWQIQQYRDMNSLMENFRQSTLFGVGMQSSFLAKMAVSSNDNVVSVKANGSNVNPLNTIDSITSLATSAKWISNAAIADNSGKAIDPTAKLNTINFANGSTNAGPLNLNFNVTNPDGTTSNVPISVDPSKDSLNDVLNRINSSALGVSAFYDTATQKVVLTNKNTGAGSSIVANDPATANFMTAIGIQSDASLKLTQTNAGTDAVFSINGLATSRKTNTFTINNATYTLKQTTTTPVNISISTDTDSIFNTIKSFVDNYNNVIDKVNGKMTESRYRDYPPLTDAQKSAMKDADITNWNTKAQSGLIRNDNVLTSSLTNMRSALFTPVTTGSNIKLLSDIGITTSSNYLDNGKLIIKDEAKLRQAIQDDPNGVANLFTSTGTPTNPTDPNSAPNDQKGLAVRLNKILLDTTKNVALKAGSSTSTTLTSFTLGRNENDLNQQIAKFQDHLTDVENRYYAQFNAMDQAISKANSQMSMFMSKFG
jgi:flagellar hook-associated protein 2